MRLYHFTDQKHGLQDIQRQSLKIARINELNDPFEFLGAASRNPKTRQRYAVLKKGWAEYMGVLCFSGSWRNPVQWSHYADHHHGVCLGFDITTQVHKVNYVDQRLKPNSIALAREGPAAEIHVIEILTTKFRHWEYEEEYRVFPRLEENDARGLYFFSFGEQMLLKQVIVGHHSTLSRTDVSNALGQASASIEIIKARLAFQSFRVVRQNIPSACA
jgi:hypothetical protein